jgi:hypothetical protein
MTVWVTVGAAAGAFAEPHAARLRPAANAMAGIATTLLSFIVLPSPYRNASCHSLLTEAYEVCTLVLRAGLPGKAG